MRRDSQIKPHIDHYSLITDWEIVVDYDGVLGTLENEFWDFENKVVIEKKRNRSRIKQNSKYLGNKLHWEPVRGNILKQGNDV